MIDFKEWCKKLAPVAEAAAKGIEIQWLSRDGWVKKELSSGFSVCQEYRIKPRTIMIGDMEIPEPMREVPDNGCEYFVPMLHATLWARIIWVGDNLDLSYFANGVCHKSSEDARAHAKALIALTEKK